MTEGKRWCQNQEIGAVDGSMFVDDKERCLKAEAEGNRGRKNDRYRQRTGSERCFELKTVNDRDKIDYMCMQLSFLETGYKER